MGCESVDPPAEAIATAAAVAATLRDSISAPALHAAALVDLVWGATGSSLDRSIESLRMVSRVADRPASAFADLSAALTERASQTGSPRDHFEAMDAAAVAHRLAPRLPHANIALARAASGLGLDTIAVPAWRSAGVAGDRWRVAAERRFAGARSTARDSLTERYRVGGWADLGTWGQGIASGDTGAAHQALRRATVANAGLDRLGGDASLGAALEAIRGAGTGGRDPLAAGHAAYSQALREYAAGRYAAAANLFGQAASAADRSPALRMWSEVYLAASMEYRNDRPEADRILDRLRGEVDADAYPALAGRTAWTRATVLLRSGRYEAALAHFREAERHFEQAGERENVGAVQALAVDAAFALGDADGVYAGALRARRTLAPYPGSVRLHNVLSAAALQAARDGMPDAALAVQAEGLRAARRTGRPEIVAEAHLLRARLAAGAGRADLARGELLRGETAVRQVPGGERRRWLTADLRLTRATLGAASGMLPGTDLDSAYAFFRGLDNPLRALPLLVARGEARLAAGDSAGRLDLELAADALAELRLRTRSGSLASAQSDAARPVIDRAVMMRLARGDTLGALRGLERGRASLAGPRAWDAASDQSVVVIAVIGDTMLTWLTGPRPRFRRALLPAGELAASAARLTWSLERRVEPALGRELAALSEWILRPVEDGLGPAGSRVTFVVDGELAGIPFAALTTRDGRFLAERHVVRLAASLADAGLDGPGQSRRERVLLVGSHGGNQRRGLPSLPGVARELDWVGALYPDAVTLRGREASRDRLLAELAVAELFHFAGHAVWEDGPDGAWLSLTGQGDGSDRLTASELAARDLGRLRLVVLSACRTTGRRVGRSGAIAGFSSRLLAAGAGGVVGSLWRVEDEATAALMRELHRHYSAGVGPAEALRAAQLTFIRSADPRLRSPAAWAGFVYAGL